MKLFLFVLSAFISSYSIFAQSKSTTQYPAQSDWRTFNNLEADGDIEKAARKIYNLHEEHNFSVIHEKVDDLQMTHVRLKQQYKNIPVYGMQTVLHLEGDKIISSNGRLAQSFDDPAMSNYMSKAYAIDQAKKIIPSSLLAYKHEAFKNTEPSAELVWYAPDVYADEPVYRLAYRVDIYSLKPHYRYDYFIDPLNGEEMGRIPTLIHETVPRTTETIYYGEQEISVDSTDAQVFTLNDSVRQVYTTTIDIDRLNEEQIYNGDSIWSLDQHIYGELDAHWGAAKTYDYFLNVFGRNSVDGQGLPMESKIIREFGVSNAFWTGQFSVFGAGNGSGTRPFSVLDVVGHEFTHGVVDFTADLIYQGESGALNESFADILGKGVEYHTVPEAFSWEQGAGIRGETTGIRNIQDPKKYNDPNYYRGEFWASTTSEDDNGGVHSNSGVQNFWFYLLSEGQTGINEVGEMYEVSALGIEKAEQIAYRNLAYYLTPTSSYIDAVRGSIRASIDLYGSCSEEHRAVVDAWRAVGLWRGSLDENNYSLQSIQGVETACGLSEISISAVFLRQHCLDIVDPNEVELFARVDDLPTIHTLSSIADLQNFNDTLLITFPESSDVSEVGMHEITVYFSSIDQNPMDDTLRITFENILQQNSDFASIRAKDIYSSCDLSNSPINGVFTFNGCDSIEAGATLDISYVINGDEDTRTTETYVTTMTLFPGDPFNYSFSEIAHVEMEGAYNIALDVDFAGDPFTENNLMQVAHVYHTRSINDFQEFKFFKPDEVDEEYSYLKIGDKSMWNIQNGRRHLRLSGSTPYDDETDEFSVDLPQSEEEMWVENRDYKNQYCFCIDAQAWGGGAIISFDHAVLRSSLYDSLGIDQTLSQYSSALRLVANGSSQVMPTILGYPWSIDSSLVYRRDTIVLSDFSNQYFDLCFESHHFLNDNDINGEDPDATHLDNIIIEENILTATREEIDRSNQIKIYPNPASDLLFINSPDNLEINNYKILSVEGRIVVSEDVTSDGIKSIHIQNLQPGYYLLQLSSNQNTRFTKYFIKTGN